ncbi:MAG: tetratricopeptide repeat protein [Spirochaetaceae bacterium]|jgi:putative GTP pyrophosphokinase|nr:tetratricopeptide repeat protein [Spirochaetaceae bacterium]
MKKDLPDKSRLREEFNRDFETRKLITRELEEYIEGCLRGLPSNYIVRARVKNFDSYFKKYISYLKTFKNEEAEDAASGNGIPMIHDTIGVRVICPFIDDIQTARREIERHFEVAEVEQKGNEFSFKEFGYNSLHLLVRLPQTIGGKYQKSGGGNFTGEIAEIQVRTILQDAWAEVEHELVYKAEWTPYDLPMKRKLAAVNASLTLADAIFEEIRSYQKRLHGQFGRRRQDFFRQVEEQMDAVIFEDGGQKPASNSAPLQFQGDASSIDDILLNALYAHNKGHFNEAIGFYTKMMDMKPETKVASIILKHRGMAYFAQGIYKEAVADFEASLDLDPASYKSAYYCGIVRSCLKEWQRAADDFSKSLVIYPYQVYCLFRRAQVYYHIEDYPAAIADCEAALNLDHEFEQARRLKELLLDKLRM